MKSFHPLDLLLDPVVVIDKDYRIVFANKGAKELFGNPQENQKCYSYIFGFEKPCWNYAGYTCPIKHCSKHKKACTLAVALNTKESLQKKLVRQYKTNGLFVELYMPLDELKKVTEQTKKFSFKDNVYLTKEEFERLLIHLLKQGKKFLLTAINIKKLRYINEIYGIPAGDLVIKAVEQVLGRLATKYKFKFSQVAGGYFVLIPYMDFETVEKFEKAILKQFLKVEITYLSSRIRPRIRITTVEINPQRIKRLSEIYKLLLFAEKKAGGLAVAHIFEDKQEEFLELLRRKEEAIRHLYKFLEERKITFYLQPIVSLKDGTISHYEVLMRFLENGKVVSAGTYIDLIYELGLIAEFDTLLLELLGERIGELSLLGKPIFINISDEDLRLFSYRRKLKKLLSEFADRGIPISLEITEQTLFKEWEFIEALARDYNLKFVIDDFGSGYSSLKMVADIVAKGLGNYLKLDCSLVKNYLTNPYIKAMVDGIVSFTRNTHLKTVAECVENEEIKEALRKAGIDYGQGWYFYKPMPLEEALKLSA